MTKGVVEFMWLASQGREVNPVILRLDGRMSGNSWKFVGGPNDGELAPLEPAAGDNDILHDGFRYVVRHHDRILLFHATDESMEERAILKRRECSQV